ncbi:hypothetical protein ABTN69_20015, partial [Acinetobacter baumannii]
AASTPTFIPPEAKDMQTGYVMVANPTLFPGQTVVAELVPGLAKVKLCVDHYTELDETSRMFSEEFTAERIEWTVPDTGGQP